MHRSKTVLQPLSASFSGSPQIARACCFFSLFFFTRSGDRFSHGQRLPRGGGERADDSRRTPSVHVGQFQQHQPPGFATILQLHLRQDAAASFQAVRCMRVTETDRDCSPSS